MKILIIDDEVAAQTRLVALLKPFGDCDTASDGPEAILKIQQSYLEYDFYDLMAIDINIPSISGLDLLTKIYHDENMLNMPISKKLVFLYISIVAGFMLGLVRIMAGGHFLSDIFFAGIFIVSLNVIIFEIYKRYYVK